MAKRLKYAGFRQPDEYDTHCWYDDNTGIPFTNREINGFSYRCHVKTGFITGNLFGDWQASDTSFAVPLEELVQRLPPGCIHAPLPEEIEPVMDLDADGYARIWLTLATTLQLSEDLSSYL